MCDYSLRSVASRPAKVDDHLVVTTFPNCFTRGFAAADDPDVAICLVPGTEVAFAKEAEVDRLFWFLPHRRLGSSVARFCRVNEHVASVHHDALEFPSGEKVLITQLSEGQRAVVLQLPATAHPAKPKTAEPTLLEPGARLSAEDRDMAAWL
jgi:hypothetical protein